MTDLRGIHWIEAIHPEDRGRVLEVWSRANAAGAPYTWEARVRRHDGVYRWLAMQATLDPDGQSYRGTFVDVTHQHRRDPVPMRPARATLTAREVAERLHVSVPTVYRLVRQGRLPFARRVSARTLRFDRAGLESWLRKPYPLG